MQIWVRNYQILDEQPNNALEARETKKESGQSAATALVEIGPRFVLDPIRVFRGSFGGQTLFRSLSFVPPNELRSEQQSMKRSYEGRKFSKEKRQARASQLKSPDDPLSSVFR